MHLIKGWGSRFRSCTPMYKNWGRAPRPPGSTYWPYLWSYRYSHADKDSTKDPKVPSINYVTPKGRSGQALHTLVYFSYLNAFYLTDRVSTLNHVASTSLRERSRCRLWNKEQLWTLPIVKKHILKSQSWFLTLWGQLFWQCCKYHGFFNCPHKVRITEYKFPLRFENVFFKQ